MVVKSGITQALNELYLDYSKAWFLKANINDEICQTVDNVRRGLLTLYIDKLSAVVTDNAK
ncbi:9589_t:CDS:2, partial [Entrophospora sp. SA101]